MFYEALPSLDNRDPTDVHPASFLVGEMSQA